MTRGAWVRGVALGLVVLTVLVARVWLAGSDELRAAAALERRGEVDLAITHYRRAARWYLPASPVVSEALEALARIGQAAERAGDPERALAAWRAVRSAILSTRGLLVPNGERLAAANTHIAALMATHAVPPMDAGKAPAALRAEHLALLEAAPRPEPLWVLVALVGFGLWVGGALWFFSRGADENDRLVRAVAKRAAVLVAVGLVLFVLGLRFA